MIPANIEVKIDDKAVKEYIQEKIDKQIQETLFLCDVKKLAEVTSMSQRFLEDEILSDPRMKLIERRRNRKRWWFYETALKTIEEIINEW